MSVRVLKILGEVSARNPEYLQSAYDSVARLRDDVRAGAPLGDHVKGRMTRGARAPAT